MHLIYGCEILLGLKVCLKKSKEFLVFQSRQPFMTICQMSTIDGSPKLERQVQKLTIQMNHQIPDLKAAGYFTLGRNMILKVILLFWWDSAITLIIHQN